MQQRPHLRQVPWVGLLLFAAIMAACRTRPPFTINDLPVRQDAVTIAWRCIGAGDKKPPEVRFIDNPYHLNCGNGTAFLLSGMCLRGAYHRPAHFAEVAHPAGWKLADTALVHELLRAHIGGHHKAPQFVKLKAKCKGELREMSM